MKILKRMLLITLMVSQYATATFLFSVPIRPSLTDLSILIAHCEKENPPPLSEDTILEIQENIRALFLNPAKAVLDPNKEDLRRFNGEIKNSLSSAQIIANMKKVLCGPVWKMEDDWRLKNLAHLISFKQYAERTDALSLIREWSVAQATITQKKNEWDFDARHQLDNYRFLFLTENEEEIYYHLLCNSVVTIPETLKPVFVDPRTTILNATADQLKNIKAEIDAVLKSYRPDMATSDSHTPTVSIRDMQLLEMEISKRFRANY